MGGAGSRGWVKTGSRGWGKKGGRAHGYNPTHGIGNKCVNEALEIKNKIFDHILIQKCVDVFVIGCVNEEETNNTSASTDSW